jgi:hypothetical protein
MCKPPKRGWQDKKTPRDLRIAIFHEREIANALSVPLILKESAESAVNSLRLLEDHAMQRESLLLKLRARGAVADASNRDANASTTAPFS